MDDLISRQAAIDALAKNMPSLTTPDGCGEFDHDIQVTDEAYVDCMQIIHELPSAQPGWIPVTERLPKMTDTYLVQVGINENGEGMHTEARTADWNAVWQTWYVHTTRNFVGDIIKWMSIPWEGGQNG